MELQEQVIKIVSETIKADPKNISLTSSFVDDLHLDSLDMVELVMKMEDEFSLEIPEKEAEKLKTINDVMTFLADHKKH
jgi:acyl carrier protein